MKLSSEFLSLIEDKGWYAVYVTIRRITMLLVVTVIRILMLLGLSRIVRVVIIFNIRIQPKSLVDWILYVLGGRKTAREKWIQRQLMSCKVACGA